LERLEESRDQAHLSDDDHAHTSSTDSFATPANQTPDPAWLTQSDFAALNDWIRSDPAPLTGYIEIANVISNGSNSRIWKAGHTADGVHPNGTGHTVILNRLPDLKTL
jgi:lysophospholipase L1-like esterase